MILQEFEEKTIRVLVHVCSVCSERFEVDPNYSSRALKDAALHFVDEHLDLASLEWEPSGVDESDPPLWARRSYYIESERIYGMVSHAWSCHSGCWEGPGWYSRDALSIGSSLILRRVDRALSRALQNAEFEFEQAKEALEFLQKKQAEFLQKKQAVD